jgi:predicted HTH domain antitoxin
MAVVGLVSQECPAGCCPHESVNVLPDTGCPDDLPEAPLPERAVHLYTCQMHSTRKIAVITRADRGRIARLLHEAGIIVAPHGAGRQLTRRTAGSERLDHLMATLYLEQRMSTTQIAELTGIPDHAVLYRLRSDGVPIRTRGRNNREDRTVIPEQALEVAYVNTGLAAAAAGKLLGVSGKIVLRSAHDQGLPVRVGGAPPSRGPSEIELLTTLYANAEVRGVLDRHGVPVVETAGPIYERFPTPHRLSEALVVELYETCGLSLRQIELLTGRPAAAARALLRSSGIKLRPAGGRSPFMRRWRQGQGLRHTRGQL